MVAMSHRPPASVEFRNVVKRYGDVVAVDGVSFVVEAGTLVTLLGPSGCGKTTTLRMIAGLELPSEGRILIGGEDVSRLAAADRDVSMVFQSYALFPHMTVIENVTYGPTVAGISQAEARHIARETLALLGLAGYDERWPSELSGGQQQRVAVARALVLEPRVLLFDEPLSNLDAKLRRRLREDIRDLQRHLGLTVVYVTHDQQEALAVSDKIVVMSNAKIAQEGSPRTLYEAPANRFVADFIGDANLLNAQILARDGDLGRIAVGEATLELPHRGMGIGKATLAVRPEALMLEPAEGGAGLSGTVLKAAYLGTHMEYVVATSVGEVFAVDRRVIRAIAPGTAVRVEFAAHGLALVPEG